MQEPTPRVHRFHQDLSSIRDTTGQDRPIDPEPKRRRQRWGLAIAAVSVGVVALFWLPTVRGVFGSEATASRAELRTARVTRGPLVRSVSAQGRIVAATSPTLYSPVDGNVRLLVHAGQAVQRDQVLARVESPELTNLLEAEHSSLETARLGLQRQRITARRSRLRHQQAVDLAQLDLQAAERELRRATDSRAHLVISEHDYEEAVDGRDAADFAFRQATEQRTLENEFLEFESAALELALQRQQLRVAELERQVLELEVRSPVSGVVGNLAVEEGQAVDRHAALATVIDLTQLEVELSIPESYGDDLFVGAKVEITWAGQSYQGALTSVSPEVEEARILARAGFDGPPPAGIKRNQRVSTSILLESIEDTLSLPRGPFLDSGASRIAYVIEGNQARRRSVVLSPGSVARVQVVDGLHAEEEVILSSYEDFGQAETVYLSN